MKLIKLRSFFLIIILPAVIFINNDIKCQNLNSYQTDRNVIYRHFSTLTCSSQKNITGKDALQGCSVFTIAKDGRVFFGGNDDYINPDSYYWVDRADSVNYGVIWIGYPNNVQQGVNEKMLAYDANGLPRVDVNPHTERTPVQGDYTIYPIRILRECATVEEVINWINTHQWHSYMHDQMQFADSTGDAVVISAGKDGEIVFTRKPAGNGFIVSTNFNVANPTNGYGYPDWRYDKANEMLGQMVNGNKEITYKDATAVLDAVHIEKGPSWTLESMVADLKQGEIYLYYYYQFNRPVILNVKDELANPHLSGLFSSLFPEDVREEATKRYNEASAAAQLNITIGVSWTILIVASLVVLFIFPADNKKSYRFWMPVIIVFGPLGLLVRLFMKHGQVLKGWQASFAETMGSVLPVVVTYTAANVILIKMMLSGGAGQSTQVLLMLGFPLIAGWLLYHGTITTCISKKNYFRVLLRCLPDVIVTTFLGLAGTIAVALPLVNTSLKMSQLIPLSPWIIMAWWLFIVIGSIVSIILVFPYSWWKVNKGFRVWAILAMGEGEVKLPYWGKLWWLVIISIILLIAGMVAGITILKALAG